MWGMSAYEMRVAEPRESAQAPRPEPSTTPTRGSTGTGVEARAPAPRRTAAAARSSFSMTLMLAGSYPGDKGGEEEAKCFPSAKPGGTC